MSNEIKKAGIEYSDCFRLLGVKIHKTALNDAISQAMSAIDNNRQQITFACANPHSLVVAQTDRDFFDALGKTGLLVADGVGIQLATRAMNIDAVQRITGADYFYGIMQALEERGCGKVFFFGSSKKVLELLARRVLNDFPSVEICGIISPPFRPWDDSENQMILKQINAADPDVLWVGMTAPKQEKWVACNRDYINAKVIGSIGAVFDFVAGTYPRAPQWTQTIGLEWLYRLLREPKRMWKRNLVSTPIFIALVIKRHLLNK